MTGNDFTKHKDRIEKLKTSSMPLIKYLNDYYHPHVMAIVTTSSVEIVEGIANINNIDDYIKD